ncbi:MAG: hypothetical protein JKY09_06545 [Crocinitomicaceae bacterium]|nr:hypothetical protein [Crocinitomicaceae bacterium]
MLDPKNEKYTDEQILLIQDYLIQMAKLNMQLFLAKQEKRGSFNQTKEKL